MGPESLSAEAESLEKQYLNAKSAGMKLDMSRGKPSPEMLDLSLPMLDAVGGGSDLRAEDGSDARNYGGLCGIPEARRLFSEILGVSPDRIIVMGNSSLNLMFDLVMRGYCFGTGGDCPPQSECRGRKWLCPSPGYDRHFAVTELFGYENIPVEMTPEGPDAAAVEKYCEDPDVKGMWMTPVYANPTGICCSARTIERLASLRPAAKDFRILCDNAYAMHRFPGSPDPGTPNLLLEAEKRDSGDMVYLYTSMSKITFAGGGICALALSENNFARQKKLLSIQTISYDKISQLRHARFFGDFEGVRRHMERYMAVLYPKFRLALDIFERELAPCGAVEWTRPDGGFFISVDVPDGCAKETVRLCREAGLTLTGAGAAFPYGRDPRDRNIRIAPSCPGLPELEKALELFCVCARLAAVRSLLRERGLNA